MLGLKNNIKYLHTLRIFETAAALALVIAPDKAEEYLRKLGVEIESKGDEGGALPQDGAPLTDPTARMQLAQLLGGLK